MSTDTTFSAKDVMALRQKTGLGMMDCKKALAENNGDLNAAEEWLRAQRKGKMDQRTERATGEGRIGIAIEGDKAAIVEVRTETDFTARNDQFVEMVDKVTKAIMRMPAGEITEPTPDITKLVDDVRITTGENANFSRATRIDGGHFGQYLHHDGKRGVLLQVDDPKGAADDELLKGICQHIVFHDPLGVDEKDVPAETLDQIRSEALAEAKESGKNDEIAGKIADGKVRKYLEEKTLLHQKYVLDESKTIKQILPEGVVIKQFVRYTLGS